MRPKDSGYRDTFPVKVYIMAVSGMSQDAMAKDLGVADNVLARWIEEKPAMRFAIAEANKRKGKGNSSFRTYLYAKLPADLKVLWDKINECELADNPMMQLEPLLDGQPTHVKQHLFLYAIVHHNFNASKACSSVGIDITTLREWVKQDPKFARLVNEMHYHKKNLYEESLVGLVNGGDVAATIFANRTFNKDRGYADKQVIDVNVQGQIDHKHKFDLSELDLSLECRKEIRDAIRRHKQAQEQVIENKAEDGDDVLGLRSHQEPRLIEQVGEDDLRLRA